MNQHLERAARLDAVRHAAAARDIDAVLLTPGPALRYLTGYAAVALERLTALVIPVDDVPSLVVPLLERPAAEQAVEGLRIVDWTETMNPYAVVASLLPGIRTLAVDDHLWAARVMGLAEAMPGVTQSLAGTIVDPLRAVKSAGEVEALAEAGRAIDSVHEQVPTWLRAGRTEREVGRDIAEAILAAGHDTVDFVIVASGPNGASPHHEVSDRTIRDGDIVVVDIGGTMPSGYCSDSTRTYAVGEPPGTERDYYTILQAAQEAACAAVRPGVTAESIDTAARSVISAAGFGAEFIHRTGHGIGLETHEHPYVVEGNTTVLEPGMAFSVEPGIYLPNRSGARIEDIVVVTEDGGRRLNNTSHDLIVLPANG